MRSKLVRSAFLVFGVLMFPAAARAQRLPQPCNDSLSVLAWRGARVAMQLPESNGGIPTVGANNDTLSASTRLVQGGRGLPLYGQILLVRPGTVKLGANDDTLSGPSALPAVVQPVPCSPLTARRP
jgi:hypothetical protein